MKKIIGVFLIFSILMLGGCSYSEEGTNEAKNVVEEIGVNNEQDSIGDESINESNSNNSGEVTNLEETSDENLMLAENYAGEPYVVLNENNPDFTDDEKQNTTAFESYSELDELGRCQVAYANICEELMPTEERGEIGSIKPTGWHTVKYDALGSDLYLYNRCHLIGYQLAGENANEKNLITGTRYLNVVGMLPFENVVAEYVKETGNHVLYRVTPIFLEDNLLAEGVKMEAYSVEDDGSGICFNVFCYNVQPGIEINYSNGESVEIGTDYSNGVSNDIETDDENTESGASQIESDENETNISDDEITSSNTEKKEYVLNTKSMKFHDSSCSSVDDIKESNKAYFTGTREELIEEGYSPCKRCNP